MICSSLTYYSCLIPEGYEIWNNKDTEIPTFCITHSGKSQNNPYDAVKGKVPTEGIYRRIDVFTGIQKRRPGFWTFVKEKKRK